jgi:hypothetical protein
MAAARVRFSGVRAAWGYTFFCSESSVVDLCDYD